MPQKIRIFVENREPFGSENVSFNLNKDRYGNHRNAVIFLLRLCGRMVFFEIINQIDTRPINKNGQKPLSG
jgi:hypothetical protein